MTKQAIAPEQSLLDQFNDLFKRLMYLLREQAKLKRKYAIESEKLKTTYDGRNSRLQAKIDEIKKHLADLMEHHRSELLTGDLKSFVTAFARFSYRSVSASFKIADKAEALKVARKLGIMRRVCKISVSFTVDADKLEAYLATHPEHRDAFDPFIEETDDHDSLSVKANEGYLTTYDPNRLSSESIRLRD